jgi:hypothetical protein
MGRLVRGGLRIVGCNGSNHPNLQRGGDLLPDPALPVVAIGIMLWEIYVGVLLWRKSASNSRYARLPPGTDFAPCWLGFPGCSSRFLRTEVTVGVRPPQLAVDDATCSGRNS